MAWFAFEFYWLNCNFNFQWMNMCVCVCWSENWFNRMQLKSIVSEKSNESAFNCTFAHSIAHTKLMYIHRSDRSSFNWMVFYLYFTLRRTIWQPCAVSQRKSTDLLLIHFFWHRINVSLSFRSTVLLFMRCRVFWMFCSCSVRRKYDLRPKHIMTLNFHLQMCVRFFCLNHYNFQHFSHFPTIH